MLVINDELRTNTSLTGALSCHGVHARFREKPDVAKWRPHLREVQDFIVYTALRGFIIDQG